MKHTFLFILTVSIGFSVHAQTLREQLQHIVKDKHATVGIAVYNIETGDTLTLNNSHHYPMQSTYKFHLALAVLHKLVDNGSMNLDSKVFIKKADMHPNTHSPLRDKYPNGDTSLTLREILQYTVSLSDNNGCDILFRLVRGPAAVNDYIHSLGLPDISIKATEQEMHSGWNVQYSNWTTPYTTILLLKKFYTEHLLKDSSYSFLWRTMAETSTGPNRIKAGLPAGTTLAHKTGSSDTKNGITAATNDLGIFILPNGQHVALAVYVSDSKESEKSNEKIIADIAKAVYSCEAKGKK